MSSLKLTIKIILPFILMFIVLFALNKRTENETIRENRAKVYRLIKTGQNISNAQTMLEAKGFKLVYEEPKDITGQGEQLSQLVIIGNASPNIDDIFFYCIGWEIPWRSESPYVVIDSNMDGKIITIK